MVTELENAYSLGFLPNSVLPVGVLTGSQIAQHLQLPLMPPDHDLRGLFPRPQL